MNTITVFKPPETPDIKYNKTERDILYDSFIKNASIPYHHFISFMEMEDAENKSKDIKSTLPSILIKPILKYCMPIINMIPGTVASKESKYSILLQVEFPIKCKLEHFNKQSIMVAKHDTFSIIGIQLKKKLVKTIDASFLNFMLENNIIDILKSGCFGVEDHQSGVYTQERTEYTPLPLDEKAIYFKSDADAVQKINIVQSYIKYVNNFYKNSLSIYHTRELSVEVARQKQLTNIQEYKPEIDNIDPISKKIAKLINVRLGNKYVNTYIFDKYQKLDMLNQIQLMGLSNELSKKKLQEISINKTYYDVINEFNRLKFIKILEKAKKNAISLNKFNTTIDKLNKTQCTIIDLEFNKMEKSKTLTKDYLGLELVKSLNWAMQMDKYMLMRERLTELEKIVVMPKDLKTADMLKDKAKNIIVCPHVIAKAQYMLNSAKNISSSGMLREYLINNFSMPDDNGYYCKVCGELLADADIDEIVKYISGKRISFVADNDRLKTEIWKEVAAIITLQVKFKDAVNLKNIITSITDALRPELGFIENNLLKIKSNSRDSIKDLLYIYTVVYTYAMIVNMIHNNYGRITFATRVEHRPDSARIGAGAKRKGGEPKNAKDNQKILQNIINNALFIILRTINIAINNVSSLNIESIKPILIKAYKWASSLKMEVNKHHTEEKPELSMDDDLIYNYVKYIARLHHYYKGNKFDKSLKYILGRNESSIQDGFKDNISIYATAVIPEPWSNTKLCKYQYDSFMQTMEYIKKKIYKENAVPYSNILSEHVKKYSYLNQISDQVFYDGMRTEMKPYNRIELLNNLMITYNNFDTIKTERYYDNNGNSHKFNIYVYQMANSKGLLSGAKKEYTKADVNKWLSAKETAKTKEFKNMFIVDERCSVCNVLMSQVKNISVDKALAKNEDINAFFQYFENRCPKGELHNFIISEKEGYCDKCNMTKKIFNEQDKKFYDKYEKMYEKIISDKIEYDKNTIDEITTIKKINIDKKSFPAWKITNYFIMDVSKTFKIKYNIWINLGLSINNNYHLIETESINPSENQTPDIMSLRNIQLYSYYLNVVTTYNIIKHYESAKFIPYYLKIILDKNNVGGLYKKLTNLEDILSQYEYYKLNADPHVLSNFLLSSISSTIINVYNIMKKAGMDTAFALTEYIIKILLESDKLLSNPDIAKFKSALYKTNDIDTTINVDGVDADVEQSDVESEKSDEDAEPDDVFSIADMDIEQDADENLISNAMDF